MIKQDAAPEAIEHFKKRVGDTGIYIESWVSIKKSVAPTEPREVMHIIFADSKTKKHIEFTCNYRKLLKALGLYHNE